VPTIGIDVAYIQLTACQWTAGNQQVPNAVVAVQVMNFPAIAGQPLRIWQQIYGLI
jgi:hypothetical protein